jgi:hypothetical protein
LLQNSPLAHRRQSASPLGNAGSGVTPECCCRCLIVQRFFCRGTGLAERPEAARGRPDSQGVRRSSEFRGQFRAAPSRST